jgi:hypothetical protein
MQHIRLLGVSMSMALLPAAPSFADDDAAALARATQNPVADLISVPFQNNTNYNVGFYDNTQNVLNIQPVMPFSLNDKTNLITRTIVPVISQGKMVPGGSSTSGIGDIQFTAFYSPKEPTRGGLIWGAGPVLLMDTATDDDLGTGKWSAGPSLVFLKMTKDWVIGVLLQNVWDFAGDGDRDNVNSLLAQPFINYNFPHKPGRYLSFSPIITANWEADSDDVWTVPLGLQIGQILKIGKQPVNISGGAYYNVAKPKYGADWTMRLQFTLLFPK